MPSVRPAVPDDARAIAQAHLASWRAAYSGLIPEEVLDGLDEVDLAHGWARRIDTPEPAGASVLLLEEEGVVRGYCHLGPSRDTESILTGGTAEIYGFYLHPTFWGRGIGGVLMETALTWLGRQGYQFVTLNVLEGNERARLFYERKGWIVDKEAAPWYGAAQVRYRKEL